MVRARGKGGRRHRLSTTSQLDCDKTSADGTTLAARRHAPSGRHSAVSSPVAPTASTRSSSPDGPGGPDSESSLRVTVSRPGAGVVKRGNWWHAAASAYKRRRRGRAGEA